MLSKVTTLHQQKVAQAHFLQNSHPSTRQQAIRAWAVTATAAQSWSEQLGDSPNPRVSIRAEKGPGSVESWAEKPHAVDRRPLLTPQARQCEWITIFAAVTEHADSRVCLQEIRSHQVVMWTVENRISVLISWGAAEALVTWRRKAGVPRGRLQTAINSLRQQYRSPITTT